MDAMKPLGNDISAVPTGLAFEYIQNPGTEVPG
jgi:hypothetical protein